MLCCDASALFTVTRHSQDRCSDRCAVCTVPGKGLGPKTEQSRATLKEHRSSRIRRAVPPHHASKARASSARLTVKTASKSLSSASRTMFLECMAGSICCAAGASAGQKQSSSHTAEFYTSICSSCVVYMLKVLVCNAWSRGFEGLGR